MSRTIIVGDVHGCLDELDALLSRISFLENADRLIFVGDLVGRGPNSRGVLRRMIQTSAAAVRGNHEAKLLRGRSDSTRLHGEYERLAATLSADEWLALETMPLWLDLPEHVAIVVHGGVVPGQRVEKSPPEALLTIRAVDVDGRWTADKNAKPLWGELYVGPPHVVFGHNALNEPQLHKWATGIDTGCVYGGRLTALLLDEGEPLSSASVRLVTVPARQRYFPG